MEESCKFLLIPFGDSAGTYAIETNHYGFISVSNQGEYSYVNTKPNYGAQE